MPFIENTDHGVTYITAPNISAAHAFTTRYGGVSSGVYESLNLGVSLGDDPGCVRENYGRLCRALKITEEDFVRLNQVHGSRVIGISREQRGNLYTAAVDSADGLITCDPGVALAVYTADCTPVLLHDPVRGAIGAVHAGWRGTAADIAGEAVRKMCEAFGCLPANINAAIGPCISKCCYETDQDVAVALRMVLGDDADRCITQHSVTQCSATQFSATQFSVTRNGGKFMIDLKEANRLLLVKAGLLDVAVSGECTSCLCDKYWSHRRTKCLRGSQAAVIAIMPGYRS